MRVQFCELRQNTNESSRVRFILVPLNTDPTGLASLPGLLTLPAPERHMDGILTKALVSTFLLKEAVAPLCYSLNICSFWLLADPIL